MLSIQEGATKIVATHSNNGNSKPKRIGRNIDG